MNRETKQKEMVMASAIRLFAAHGFANVTMEEIAKKVGLSRATVYNHFGKKENIYRTFVSQYLDQLKAKMQNLSDKTGLQEKLFLYIKTSVNHFREMVENYPSLRKEYFKDYDSTLQYRKEVFDYYYKLVKTVLSRGLTEEVFYCEDINSTTSVIVNSIRGLELQCISGDNLKNIDKEIDDSINFIVNALSLKGERYGR